MSMKRLAFLRSLLIYRGIPLRAGRLRRFYAPFVRPGDLCFDVGAHLGNHTAAWLALGARVVAVEPHPRLMDALRGWYGADDRVTLLEAALGAEPGLKTLRISSRHPTVATLSAEWIAAVRSARSFAGVEWDAARPVRVHTLDALIEHHGEPAFCKIDVEGGELDVLRGLSRPLPALSIEYIPAALDFTLRCLDLLAALGDYEYNRTVGERMRLESAQCLSPAAMAGALRALPPDARSGDLIARRRGAVG